MPQCPICNAAVWVGQRYCATCDNYLRLPEEDEQFCPRCGLRVDSKQEICHKCKTALSRIAVPPSQPAVVGPRRLPGGYGPFFTIGLVVAILLVVLFAYKSPGPPQREVTPPSRAPAPQTPAHLPTPPAAAASLASSASAAPNSGVRSQPETPSPPTVTPPKTSPPRYVVNINYLALRNGPSVSAVQISTFNFRDEVELLETSGAWGRVRDVRRNIVGWCNMHYLKRGSG